MRSGERSQGMVSLGMGNMDRMARSNVSRSMVRSLGAVLLACALVACGGGSKKSGTTPAGGGSGTTGDGQSMTDTGDPVGPAGTVGGGTGTVGGGGADTWSATGDKPGTPGTEGGGEGSAAPGPDLSATPTVIPPNFDPDPAQARTQVEQHLAIARSSLARAQPDADGALKEARLALAIDASSVDAAAMVALAYYHKKLFDTAELVLDDVFKRDAAKTNANVMYVYGLVYDRTGRPDRALVAYQKAVGINPGHTSALTNLGVHQLKNTQYAEAQRTFERLTKEFGKSDEITLTSLGSAYRGRSADYPAGSPDREQWVRAAEAQYKKALQASSSYGPAYYNLGLLYLDNDPFPGVPDPIARLTTAKSFFEQYKNMPGVEIKLYDDRMKDVSKAIKRAEKLLKKKSS